MIKKLQTIGNSKGIILDHALRELLGLNDDNQVEIIPKDDGILIRKVSVQDAYKHVSEKHRKSLDKLGR